eukprot:3700474-Prymnesium_polylepis.1
MISRPERSAIGEYCGRRRAGCMAGRPTPGGWGLPPDCTPYTCTGHASHVGVGTREQKEEADRSCGTLRPPPSVLHTSCTSV